MKNKQKIMAYTKMIILVCALIIADQLIKEIIPKDDQALIPGLVRVTYAENTGGAFSLGSNSLLQIIIVNIIIIGIILRFVCVQFDKLNSFTKIVLSFILAGGLSNLLDRVIRGFVIDYININDCFKFPIFNLADIYIVLGWIIFIILTIRYMRKKV